MRIYLNEIFLKIFISRTFGSMSIKLCTKYLQVKGIQIGSIKGEGPRLFPRGDDNEIVKMHFNQKTDMVSKNAKNYFKNICISQQNVQGGSLKKEYGIIINYYCVGCLQLARPVFRGIIYSTTLQVSSLNLPLLWNRIKKLSHIPCTDPVREVFHRE